MRIDPGEAHAARDDVQRLLDRARGRSGPWWPEAVANLERLVVAEVPDVTEARRWYQYGHHIVDEQASTVAQERRRR